MTKYNSAKDFIIASTKESRETLAESERGQEQRSGVHGNYGPAERAKIASSLKNQ